MVRAFQTGDLERVAEIWLEANTRSHDFIPRQYWQDQLPLVRTLLPQAELYVWQEAGGGVQGFLGLNGTYIEGLFVWPAVQSQGIGKALLDHAKASRGSLTLSVYRKNDRADAFYRREGFRVQHAGVDESTGEAEYRMIWERSAPC